MLSMAHSQVLDELSDEHSIGLNEDKTIDESVDKQLALAQVIWWMLILMIDADPVKDKLLKEQVLSFAWWTTLEKWNQMN